MKAKTTTRSKSAHRSRPVASRIPRETERKTLYELLKPFIGMIKDGPSDLARNHKLYASGAKKWK